MNNILIVNDLAEHSEFLAKVLNKKGYKTQCVKTEAMALKAVELVVPDLILLNIKITDLDGYQICQKFKADVRTKDIPIIFISALDNALDKVKAFEVGGVDYLIKPFTPEEVLVRVENHISLRSIKHQLNRLNVALEKKVAERILELEIINQNLIAINQQLEQKIFKRQKVQQQLIQNALYDNLTGLPNRTLLLERIDRAIEQSKRNSNYLFAVLFIDLDRLKTVNDSLGHLIGDKLLKAAAKLLSEDIRSVDTVARLGGDEFVILLGDIHSLKDATLVGDRLQAKFNQAFVVDDYVVCTGASIGIVLSSSNYDNSLDILRDADTAMYRAKQKGKGRYEVFDRHMHRQTLNIIELEQDLRSALRNKEFFLSYQPIIALNNKSPVGFEALIRWQHPQRGSISPKIFLPVARNTGLILSIGDWVLAQACRQLAYWQKEYAYIPEVANLIISINVASQQITEPNYIKKLDRILVETGINPKCLRLEITEQTLVNPNINAQKTLLQIKERNIRLSIDDFGTGYSCVSYLHRLPIDSLKIDRSFVTQINCDRESQEIVKTIITLAHTLNTKAIAEGVETKEQLQTLQTLGCEFAQGYFFAKPLNVTKVNLMLEKNFSAKENNSNKGNSKLTLHRKS